MRYLFWIAPFLSACLHPKATMNDQVSATELTEIRLASGTTEVEFLTYGLTLTRFSIDGETYVVSLPKHAYLGEHPYVGTIVGPVANRIAKGRFVIDGKTFDVTTNENGNTLHSGPEGFERQVWEVRDVTETTARFRYRMPNGYQGYPGPLTVDVTAKVEPGALELVYEATTERPTPVSLTHHTYFTMPGVDGIDGLDLAILAPSITRVDGQLIPTDYADPLELGDPLDFRGAKTIGNTFIDNSFNLGEGPTTDGLREAVKLYGPMHDLVVTTDLPAVQVYSGEALEGAGLESRSGIAIEPQYPPDLINTDRAEDLILRPGEIYRHRIRYAVIPNDELVGN